jgi:hypothetical protein
MTCIPLGKILVTTPGTPVSVTLTQTQTALLPASGIVTRMEVWADTADVGISFVKSGGIKVAPLPVPADGRCEHWETSYVNPLAFQVDNTVANNGPFVTLWVE